MLRDILSNLLSADGSFKQQIFHSGFWASLLNGGERGLQLVKLVIISSILAPESFGLLGLALITMASMRQLSQLGLQEALVYHPEENVDAYLNTVWIVKAVRGVILAVLLFALAGLISSFFGEPRAKPIVQALSLTVLLEGLINPAVVYYQKDLDFHKEFLYRISGSFGDLVVATAAAVTLGTVWALVYGLLVKSTLKLVASHLLTGHSISIEFSLDYVWELFDFGRWVFLSSIVYFLVTTGDDLFVGWYLPVAALGVYQIGFRLSNAPATEIAHVVGSVMFPAISKIQDNTDRVRRLFVHALFVVGVITVPMATGIALIAPEFTEVVLGDDWLEIIPLLQILAVAGLLRALTALTGPVYRGMGIPEWNVYENVIRLLVIVLSILPLTDHLGIAGAALSVTIAIAISFFIALLKLRSFIQISLTTFVRTLLSPVVAAGLMGTVVYQIKAPTIAGISVAILVGVLLYSSVLVILVRLSSFDTTTIRKTLSGD